MKRPVHESSALVHVCIALFALCAPAAAQAQEVPVDTAEDLAPDIADGDRVLVLLVPTGELDESVADGLGELLIGAVASRREGVRIVGKEELQAQLGQDDPATLECIGSMACLGRVGVQLGVVEVIAGTLARREPRWVFNLNRVDVHRGAIVGRVFREVEGDLGAVADALSAALPELYEPEVSPAVLVLASDVRGAEVSIDGAVVGTLDGELRREGLAPGRHTVRVSAPGYVAWERAVSLTEGTEVHLEARLRHVVVDEQIHPLAWIAGGVAIAAMAAAIPLGVVSQTALDPSEAQRRSMEVTRADVLAFYDARSREAIAADVLFAVAGAAAIASLVALFFPVRRELGEAGLTLGPGGAILGGRF